MVNSLAEALAKDIADIGLANLESNGVLKSLDGSTVLEIEQEGDIVSIFENGEHVLDLDINDGENFNEEFIKRVSSSLNF